MLSASGNSHTSEDRDKIKELRKVVKNSEARNNMLQFALCQFGWLLADDVISMRWLALYSVKFDPNNKLKPSRSEEVVSVGCKDFSRLLYDPEREDCTELLTPQPTITLPLGATLNPLQVFLSLLSSWLKFWSQLLIRFVSVKGTPLEHRMLMSVTSSSVICIKWVKVELLRS